ncbi:hypothetical protein AUT26_16645 [[Arthrobacter] sp. ATCC 21022]|nr:hypothetical protein AUT26_16645 [Arthrobacter sp. ATCC 21022]KUR64491.1 hypothetical protein JM67_10700 [Arthrobacter sp. ATCC 21022]
MDSDPSRNASYTIDLLKCVVILQLSCALVDTNNPDGELFSEGRLSSPQTIDCVVPQLGELAEASVQFLL